MSARYEIFYTPEARDDLRNIRQYIACDLSAPLTAQNQIRRIVEEIDELMILPERFAVLNDQMWNQGVLRALPVDNYLVAYNVDNDAQQVNVLRIFYGRRDLPSLLRSGTE